MRVQLEIKIDTSDAAVNTGDHRAEIMRVLGMITHKIKAEGITLDQPVYDVNGARVGTYSYSEVHEELNAAELRVGDATKAAMGALGLDPSIWQDLNQKIEDAIEEGVTEARE